MRIKFVCRGIPLFLGCMYSLFFLCFVGPDAPVRADEPDKAFDVETVSGEIDELLAEYAKTSVSYQLNRKFSTWDFGYPYFSWFSLNGAWLNPLSEPVRWLIFHAVCRQDEAAFKKLSEVNALIDGGLFGELETAYVQQLADSLSLKLSFAGRSQYIGLERSTDLRWINRKRRFMAALQENRLDDARRQLITLHLLCKDP